MSKTYAFVNPDNGEVVRTMSISKSPNYYDGAVIHGLTSHDITSMENTDSFVGTKYYQDGWKEKPSKPNQFYNWTFDGWVFDSDRFWKEVRRLRAIKLYQSDWTQLPDAPLTDAQKVEWTTYRQELRDVPINNTTAQSLEEVVWPTEPTA